MLYIGVNIMIDTHSHLFAEEFNNDLEACINRAKINNVNKIVLVGFSKETNDLAQKLSNKYDIFYPTAGIHPSEANSEYLNDIEYLEDFIRNHKVYAIGECGLDYHWVSDNKEIQKDLFIKQLDLCIKYDLPVIIHSRDAISDTYDILSKYQGKIRGVMHCYSGSWEMAQRFMSLGLYISLGGPVTFKNAREPKNIALNIDLSRLLIETDCPYLAPTPFRGERNESSYVSLVCEEISRIRGIDYKEIERITEENAIRLFRL